MNMRMYLRSESFQELAKADSARIRTTSDKKPSEALSKFGLKTFAHDHIDGLSLAYDGQCGLLYLTIPNFEVDIPPAVHALCRDETLIYSHVTVAANWKGGRQPTCFLEYREQEQEANEPGRGFYECTTEGTIEVADEHRSLHLISPFKVQKVRDLYTTIRRWDLSEISETFDVEKR